MTPAAQNGLVEAPGTTSVQIMSLASRPGPAIRETTLSLASGSRLVHARKKLLREKRRHRATQVAYTMQSAHAYSTGRLLDPETPPDIRPDDSDVVVLAGVREKLLRHQCLARKSKRAKFDTPAGGQFSSSDLLQKTVRYNETLGCRTPLRAFMVHR